MVVGVAVAIVTQLQSVERFIATFFAWQTSSEW